ncbi:hypothetical protein CTI12_AA271970 [Artemisia annua]|uniref:Uncharacterized protein n=1 Tax=Artemisia annua TaxID=35608 RepID=A0A2U1NFR5_ARTAN|nr:hypothetical protein CTI12_AA271970 [Artemisia annua]
MVEPKVVKLPLKNKKVQVLREKVNKCLKRLHQRRHILQGTKLQQINKLKVQLLMKVKMLQLKELVCYLEFKIKVLRMLQQTKKLKLQVFNLRVKINLLMNPSVNPNNKINHSLNLKSIQVMCKQFLFHPIILPEE